MVSIALSRSQGRRVSMVTVRRWMLNTAHDVSKCVSLRVPACIVSGYAELSWVWIVLRFEQSRVVEGGRKPLPRRGLDETRAFIRFLWMEDLVNGVLRECLEVCLTRTLGRRIDREDLFNLLDDAIGLVLKDHVVPSEVQVCGPLGIWTWLVFYEEEKLRSRRRRLRPLSRRDWCYFAD